MATKKQKINHKNDHKEILFEDFFNSAMGTMEALEQHYCVTGVVKQIFGEEAMTDRYGDPSKANLRKSSAWTELSALYDYALHGVVNDGEEPMSIVIDGSDVLKLARSENYWPSDEWEDIIAMGDGRFSLDDGGEIAIHKLSLLAKVDQRTVRNAISAGHLIAHKRNNVFAGEQVCVENASARSWLYGRKGFKPTVVPSVDRQISLSEISGPTDFGAFLINQRARIGLDTGSEKLVVLHSSVTAQGIAQLEAGIFSLPLDAVFPLADFYQVSRKHLLDAVMRVFFADELNMLSCTEEK